MMFEIKLSFGVISRAFSAEKNFENKFASQLKEAYLLANKMPNQEVKAILEQYRKAFRI